MAAKSSNAPQFINFLGEKVKTEEEKTTQVEQQQEQPATEEPMPPLDRAPAGGRKRKAPRNPEEEEVVALTPEELLATHRFECLICNRGFARDQNLQLHMRGHNIDDWKLIKRNPNARRRRYVCPEPKCIHHDPARSLGDITGIKKHYSRKHCKKQFPCPNCDRSYAVIGDLKAHSKVCSTRTYPCSCGASNPKEINAIPVDMSNCSHGSVIHASSWNTCNALPKSAMHTPSLNDDPLRSMPSLSLSSMPVPSSKFASMNLYASLNNPISLQTFDNHSLDESEDYQLKTDDSYKNREFIKALCLSKHHPMLKDPISPLVNSPCSIMPSSSTYNFLGPPVADCGKNKNKEALG